MKIQHYSRLFTAESEKQYRARTIQRFQKIVDKRREKGEHVVFDVDIVNNDMDRWFTQKAKGTPGIKPQLEQYKTHEELHDAMQNFKSKAEIENDLKTGDFEHEGKELVLSFGVYKVFKTRDVKALTLLAQGSNWCVRYPNAAKEYIINQGSTFYIVLRETDRFVAIRETEENKPNVEVWWYTDYELRNGQTHADYTPDLMEEDLKAINYVLSQLGFTKLQRMDSFRVFPNIEEYLQDCILFKRFKRFVYNQRFYPELINRFFPPGVRIPGDLDLDHCNDLPNLPEDMSVQGTLTISRCKKLTYIPRNLFVRDSLDATCSPNLKEVKEGLYVGMDINFYNCPELESLPENWVVIGNLDLGSCVKLKTLPKGLSVRGNLFLPGCSGLTSLPEGLTVLGGINFRDCTELTSLPEGLSVGGFLNLIGCEKLTSLPKKMFVKEEIWGMNSKTGKSYQEEYIEELKKQGVLEEYHRQRRRPIIPLRAR